MEFVSYKCVAGEVGSYCQLAVTFFFGTKPDAMLCHINYTSSATAG